MAGAGGSQKIKRIACYHLGPDRLRQHVENGTGIKKNAKSVLTFNTEEKNSTFSDWCK